MNGEHRETVQFDATSDFKRLLEVEAAELNLSVGAYVLYLQTRRQLGTGAARFDRIVEEVFGRHGELMRRLAK
jgi:hypothetical protein